MFEPLTSNIVARNAPSAEPFCELHNERRDCDDYERQNNYTCDFSDKCASCKHNREIEPI